MPQATPRHTTALRHAPNLAARLGWWDERAIGYNVPQPNELIIHAALNLPADIWLDSPAALDRVAKNYIEACRDAGYFLHHTSHIKCHFARATLSGYQDRLKEYRACLAHSRSLGDKANRVRVAGGVRLKNNQTKSDPIPAAANV